MKILKKIATAAAIVVALAGATPAKADVIQLGFILDESGSIRASNWTTITSGLSSAIESLVPIDSSYEISVISFSTGTTTIVGPTLIDSAVTRTAVANAISAAAYAGGWTNMPVAFDSMTALLTGSALFGEATASYVNLATDGQPELSSGPLDAETIIARNAMIAAGIDNISVEGIGSGVDVGFLTNEICYPGPCDTTSPYNFPGQGFYIGVADAQGYADAIDNKIAIVTGRVPEPGTLAIFGLGLVGLALIRRRRKTA